MAAIDPNPVSDGPPVAGGDDLVRVSAPAKVNLALAVGDRRPDDRHEIATWMATIDLADELEIRRLEPDRLSRYAILWHEDALRRTDIDWSITRDLAVRAHLALERTVGRPLPVQLKLEKRIPVAAGLGGGSADAAAMLRGVNRLFGLGLPAERLAAIAAGLGSDVPFLLAGGTAVATGTGASIEPAAALELPIVLVMPEAACPTPQVYARFAALREERGGDPGAAGRLERVRELALAGAEAPPAALGLFNDLAGAARFVAPAIDEAFARAASVAERPVHLSGSGACGFVVCDDELHADALARTLASETGLAARAARTITALP